MRNENLGQEFSIDRYRYLQTVTANRCLILLALDFCCLDLTEFAYLPIVYSESRCAAHSRSDHLGAYAHRRPSKNHIQTAPVSFTVELSTTVGHVLGHSAADR